MPWRLRRLHEEYRHRLRVGSGGQASGSRRKRRTSGGLGRLARTGKTHGTHGRLPQGHHATISAAALSFSMFCARMSVDCDCAGHGCGRTCPFPISVSAPPRIFCRGSGLMRSGFQQTGSGKPRPRRAYRCRHGLRQLTAMAELGMGNPQYELIVMD